MAAVSSLAAMHAGSGACGPTGTSSGESGSDGEGAYNKGSSVIGLTTKLEVDRFLPAEVVGGGFLWARARAETVVQLLEIKSSSAGTLRRPSDSTLKLPAD